MNNSSLVKQSYLLRFKSKITRFFGPWGVFFRGFIKHPIMVGSIIPSSNSTIKIGTFCGPILEKLKPDATLLVIDLNEDFIKYLKQTITDSRFIAVHGSAADVHDIIKSSGFEHANYIVSGLPFSTLPDNLGEVIAQETAKVIKPGGAFLVYQFRSRVRDFMQPHFKKIDNGFSVWNILPCHLFWGWKE